MTQPMIVTAVRVLLMRTADRVRSSTPRLARLLDAAARRREPVR